MMTDDKVWSQISAHCQLLSSQYFRKATIYPRTGKTRLCSDMMNVFPSSARITAIGKYLVALTASFVPQNDVAATERRKPSPKRKRLHLLYLLNDLFHESKYHGGSSSSFASLTGQIQPYLVELFGLAAAFEREKCPKHHKRIEDLLDLWDKNGYYAPQYVEKLRETAWNAAQLGPVALDAARQAEGGFSTPSDKIRDTKNIPFVMPANHGDPSIPYYDLPAGNMMPHIIPNSTAPINPQLMKPLQFVAGPADESLVTVVKDFLQDVNNTFDQEADIDNGTVQDIDELGQPIILDEVSGERLGEAYYGWSHAFCEKMKRRREGASGTDTRGTSRGRISAAAAEFGKDRNPIHGHHPIPEIETLELVSLADIALGLDLVHILAVSHGPGHLGGKMTGLANHLDLVQGRGRGHQYFGHQAPQTLRDRFLHSCQHILPLLTRPLFQIRASLHLLFQVHSVQGSLSDPVAYLCLRPHHPSMDTDNGRLHPHLFPRTCHSIKMYLFLRFRALFRLLLLLRLLLGLHLNIL
ncbi:hypothetical protein L228DRAFT_240885 [Xylona heveae TC161]|uniref:CID domain-containing protein n=1 Tax=Xylona heveae (strain CBS 132557 / TC161) TaxID=1328760 RepID=A0A165AER0_XYLHT|nr:hypothetical protein L228DRAFT_240885 [Xylona heveae TC161]KZF20356.1 hypothetical protein L228DRAFT_240885 [Xylona heveae TC161]